MSDSVDTTVDTTSSRERIKRALSHGKKGRITRTCPQDHAWRVPCRCLHHHAGAGRYHRLRGHQRPATHLARFYLRLAPGRQRRGWHLAHGIVSTVYVTGARHAYLHAVAELAPSIWPSTPSRARSSSSFATLLTLWPRCPHRYGPVWLRLVCRGHGPGPFDGLGRSGSRALDASIVHAHHRRGHSRRSALYPLGRVRPGRHQVAGCLQDRASFCLWPYCHGHRPRHRPCHWRDRGGALHHGPGHQSTYLAARFRPPHDGPSVPACQRRAST